MRFLASALLFVSLCSVVLGEAIKARLERALDLSASPEVEIEYIHRKDREMVFLDEQGDEVEKFSVVNMSVDEINDLLTSKGIHKGSSEADDDEEDENQPSSHDESEL